jgi:sialic acid synthase SpsE
VAKMLFKNGVKIEDYSKPYIIAELGANHNGDMELAKRMIDEAKAAGCSCVKFQSWTKDTVFSKIVYEDNYFLNDDYRNRTDYTLKEIVDAFSLSEAELYSMYQYCTEIGIDFTSTPFSKREADFLVDQCNVPFIKIASMDLNNYPFLKYVARKGVPILISTGLSDTAEIDKAISIIEGEGNTQICILHCISIYPPKFENINLNNIPGLRSMYPEYPIGFSDHSLGVEIPSAAVALGACVIEKHFTLNKDMFGWDHKISANPGEMKMLVQYSQNINKALGTTRKIVCEDEIKKRDDFRRSIVAAKDIKQGTILTEKDLDLKRPGIGIPPEKIDWLIGKSVKRDIGYDELLREEDVL